MLRRIDAAAQAKMPQADHTTQWTLVSVTQTVDSTEWFGIRARVGANDISAHEEAGRGGMGDFANTDLTMEPMAAICSRQNAHDRDLPKRGGWLISSSPNPSL